jgi:NAD(P)-dependent dehydrogenase (short-subunit alcohol dehydrogenase family)
MPLTGAGRATAIELARRGADVIIGDINEDNGKKSLGHTPEALESGKSFATPESVAAVIVFLASPNAARVNGA